MARKTTEIAEREEAIARLRDLCPPGTKVYTILRHVSSSGMTRVIDAFVFYTDERDGEARPFWLSGLISTACDIKRDPKRDGLRVGGCGMDMGFWVVYTLGRYLYPDGFAPSEIGVRPTDGKRVNVNTGRGHSGPMTRNEMAAYVARGWQFEGGRNGDTSGWDNDGGYALKQEWL